MRNPGLLPLAFLAMVAACAPACEVGSPGILRLPLMPQPGDSLTGFDGDPQEEHRLLTTGTYIYTDHGCFFHHDEGIHVRFACGEVLIGLEKDVSEAQVDSLVIDLGGTMRRLLTLGEYQVATVEVEEGDEKAIISLAFGLPGVVWVSLNINSGVLG